MLGGPIALWDPAFLIEMDFLRLLQNKLVNYFLLRA
jgi:hypothetical protein